MDIFLLKETRAQQKPAHVQLLLPTPLCAVVYTLSHQCVYEVI